MADLNNAVVSLSMYFGDTKLSTGSGVFYKKDEQYFIITAWHNFSGRHSETLKCLSQHHATPDNVHVSFRSSFEEGYTGLMTVRLPLFDDNKALFYRHPVNWPRVDVVALPFDPFALHDSPSRLAEGPVSFRRYLGNGAESGRCCIFPIQNFVSEGALSQRWFENAGVTEELFIPGYPHNITDNEMQPVWKRATIASTPRMGWNREKKYVIDCASSSGMSGASVFYYNPYGSIRIGSYQQHTNGPVAVFAGIYVGRIGVTQKADPQVGIVWHPDVVDEIINGAVHDYLSAETELSPRDLEETIITYLSKSSEEVLKNILTESHLVRHFVCAHILNEIKGRASPATLLEQLLSISAGFKGPFASPSSSDLS